jgi:hypothetical protein
MLRGFSTLTAAALATVVGFSGTAWAQGLDLSSWTAESYPAVTGFDPASWDLAIGNLSVTETANAQPTLYYSDVSVQGGFLAAEVIVNTTDDDDFIGFALGFQPGDTSSASAEYLLVDWKQISQPFDFNAGSCPASGDAPAGLAVSLVTGVPTADELWQHINDACSGAGNGVQELQRGATLGNLGWLDNTTHSFLFHFTASALQVYVDGVLEIDIAHSVGDGRFAFYNFSQESTTYGGSLVGDLFLSDVTDDVGDTGDDDGISELYKVALAGAEAILMPLPPVVECDLDGDGDFNDTVAENDCASLVSDPDLALVPLESAHIAATPDGRRLYAINFRDNVAEEVGILGYYDLAHAAATGDGRWIQAGQVQDEDNAGAPVPGGVQLAFTPGGVLFAASGNTDEVYLIRLGDCAADASACPAENYGMIDDDNPPPPTVSIFGGDIAFLHDGTGYFFTNGPLNNRGLWTYTNLVDGDVNADRIRRRGTGGSGLAVRLNGLGNLVVSRNQGAGSSNAIQELDPSNGDVLNVFDMILPPDPFTHVNGDMSSGALALCGVRSKGYYKTHVDARPKKDIDTAGVTLCASGPAAAATLADEDIKDILKDAKGKNFSMLTAQLIAAILNCDLVNDGDWDDDCTRSGFPVITEAEAFLCSGITDTTSIEWWNDGFDDQDEHTDASALASALDAFNTQADGLFCTLVAEDDDDG